jgi:ABC-2 type transport system permease protein
VPHPDSPAAPTSGRSSEHHELLVPSRVALSPALEVSKRPNPFQRIHHLWQYRELVANLTRKQLKVQYKNSVLGFLWSLLNPLMYLVVFSVVFSIISKTSVPYYGIFFLAGLLAWNLFSTGLGEGTSAVVQNAQLVTKVWFPRESLVIASVLAGLVHFFLQSVVLVAALLVFRRSPAVAYIPIFLLALVVVLLLCTSLAIGLSAINVYLRDTQHLLEVVLLAWFWLSAIAYPYGQIVKELGAGREWLTSFNPMIICVVSFQRVLYNPAPPTAKQLADPNYTSVLPPHPAVWYFEHLGLAALLGLVLLYISLTIFSRLEDNFAEQI